MRCDTVGNPLWRPTSKCFSQSLAKGGVGKTRVIQAVELSFELLQRKDEVLLLAPTGAAAYNIGGRTIHTALGVDVFD
jgi:AAA domain-containing protein